MKSHGTLFLTVGSQKVWFRMVLSLWFVVGCLFSLVSVCLLLFCFCLINCVLSFSFRLVLFCLFFLLFDVFFFVLFCFVLFVLFCFVLCWFGFGLVWFGSVSFVCLFVCLFVGWFVCLFVSFLSVLFCLFVRFFVSFLSVLFCCLFVSLFRFFWFCLVSCDCLFDSLLLICGLFVFYCFVALLLTSCVVSSSVLLSIRFTEGRGWLMATLHLQVSKKWKQVECGRANLHRFVGVSSLEAE